MDWDLLGFNIPGSAALQTGAQALSREQTMEATIAKNGSAEYSAYQAGQASMSQPGWKQTALVLVLDFITIACIVWLLFR